MAADSGASKSTKIMVEQRKAIRIGSGESSSARPYPIWTGENGILWVYDMRGQISWEGLPLTVFMDFSSSRTLGRSLSGITLRHYVLDYRHGPKKII